MFVKSVCAVLTEWPGLAISKTAENMFLSVLEVGKIKVSASGVPTGEWLPGSQMAALHCVEGKRTQVSSVSYKGPNPTTTRFPRPYLLIISCRLISTYKIWGEAYKPWVEWGVIPSLRVRNMTFRGMVCPRLHIKSQLHHFFFGAL